MGTSAPVVQSFHPADTGTWNSVVRDPAGSPAAIIDTVLDFDPRSGRTSTPSAQALLDPVDAHGVSAIGEEKRSNIDVREDVDEAAFVDRREARDTTLAMPTLILPAIQFNIRAGELLAPEDNGVRYLKLPIDGL